MNGVPSRTYRSQARFAIALARIAVVIGLSVGGVSLPLSAAESQGTDARVVAPVPPHAGGPNDPIAPPLVRPLLPAYPEGGPEPTGPIPEPTPVEDPVIQGGGGAATLLGEIAAPDALSAPLVNVPGVNANANPPDTILDVGPNHVVQMTNNTGYIVYDKQGNPIPAGTPNAAIRLVSGLWPAGDVCAQDDTDPIVVYDHLADRWLIAQVIRDPAAPGGGAFNPPGPALCIAVSTTPDPTSTWYAYTYDTTDLNAIFPDYEKFGVWPDGYYMSSFEGNNLGVFVFDRTSMLVGAAAGFMKSTISALTPSAGVRNTRILPADLDGPAPAAGTPNYFVRPVDGQQDTANPTDRVEVFEAVTNWGVPSFTFTLVDTLTPAPFQVMLCNRNGAGNRDCIPQPGTANTIDALSNRPMMQAKFRNFGGDFRIVFNQTIDVSGSINALLGFTPADEVAGIRWYDLSKSGANWTIGQQGTYAPQPNGATTENQLLHRWMGSAAMDGFGSIALGYSIVNSDGANPIRPSISYSGRRFDDLLGVLTQIEQSILVGTANQPPDVGPTTARWGDYSAMTVDPVDDCTFWYTTHVANTGGGGKPTQIASFRFDTCATDLEISKTVSPEHPNAGEEIVYTITVHNAGDIGAADVVVTDVLPAEVSYLADTDACTGVAVGATGTLTCPIANIAAGESESFEIKVLVDADLGGPASITNTASVASATGEADEADNTISLTHLVNELADVRVTKFCKPDSGPAPAGSTGVCTIFVSNDGPSAAGTVGLTDVHVSDGLFSLGGPTASAGSCVSVAATATCALGDIQPGGTVRVDVPVTSANAVDVNDVARATSATPDPSPDNNQATSGLTFDASANLSIDKTGPAFATAGTQFVYTLSVDNAGPSTATNVVVGDELPSDVTFVSAVASVGSLTAVAGTVTWNLGNVAPADPVRTLAITVAVLPDATGQLVNNATVTSSTSDPDASNNLTSWIVLVDAEAALSLTKTDSPDPVLAGNELTYTLTVGNGGPSTAQDVVVTDTLPTGTTLVSAVGGTGTTACAEVQLGIISCEVGDLAPGESETIFITVHASPSLPDGTVLVNDVSASSPTDPDGADATASTTVRAQAELWMEKTGRVPAGNPAGALIYTLTVHNHPGSAPDATPTSGAGGPSDAQNVVVVDTLPLDKKKLIVQFLSPGCSYAATTHLVTCTTPTLPAGTAVTFEIQVQIKGSVGSVTNVARVTSSTPDPFTPNNTDTVNNVVHGSTGKGPKPR
jgi:uncharacterized repeat protein (TIGR01451 family)